MNLILQIQSSYNQLTKTEKKVADYCLTHRDEIPYLSITELADACEVGDTSVYRFCRTLKLEGYQEFKMKFSLSQNAADHSEEGVSESETSTTAFDALARKIMNSHKNAIEETYHLLNPSTFEKVLELLENAEQIYFFGVGDSLLVAEEARNRFLRITTKVNCITDPHMQAVAASLSTEKDLFFLISYSGSTKDNIQTAKLARERGARVVCISHFQKSPLTAYCDAVLLCGSKEGPLNRGSMSAKSAQLYLIDLLYQSMYERNPEESFKNNELATASVVDRSV